MHGKIEAEFTLRNPPPGRIRRTLSGIPHPREVANQYGPPITSQTRREYMPIRPPRPDGGEGVPFVDGQASDWLESDQWSLPNHRPRVAHLGLPTPYLPKTPESRGVHAFGDICKKASISEIKAHDLRHTHATLLLKWVLAPRWFRGGWGTVVFDHAGHLLPLVPRILG
ncbi:MAG: hypothetical protein Ct9H300mP11_23960 [Chloroflexota bacterium]|nr:MAG: hypothetical protein Ct9H300mP11_23960 [Chloroflexota bacterium]